MPSFGCDRCWPEDAEAAWEARRELVLESELLDQSHLHVMILGCAVCRQRFVSVFTELVDWADGEDDQSWTLLPVKDAEAAELDRQRGVLTERALDGVGPGRRSLRRDHPKGTGPRTSWSTGIAVGPHD